MTAPTVQAVPCSGDSSVRVVADLTHRCPFRAENDQGTATITWRTGAGVTVELHTLAALLAGFADRAMSHEDVTRDIREAITASGVAAARVVTSWTTAGLEVLVTDAVRS